MFATMFKTSVYVLSIITPMLMLSACNKEMKIDYREPYVGQYSCCGTYHFWELRLPKDTSYESDTCLSVNVLKDEGDSVIQIFGLQAQLLTNRYFIDCAGPYSGTFTDLYGHFNNDSIYVSVRTPWSMLGHIKIINVKGKNKARM